MKSRGGRASSLSAETVVAAQDALVLLVRAELNGGVRDDAHHGGRVPAPQAQEALALVGEVEEPEGLLGVGRGEGHAPRRPRPHSAERPRPYCVRPAHWPGSDIITSPILRAPSPRPPDSGTVK